MKLIISIVLISIFNFTCFAQNGPETVRGKDMMEKIDRSEIAEDEIDDSLILEDAIPKMELQKIEFEKPTVKKPTKKQSKVKKADNSSPKTSSKPEAVKKENNKKKILVSDRALSLNGLLVNDKIVINDDNTYVYRKVKTNTVQYRFTGKIPKNSKGLKLISENRYSVENIDLLKTEIPSEKVENVVKAPEKVPVKTKKAPTVKPEDKVTKPIQKTNLSKTDKIKKKFENDYNRGKEITETITKDKLLKNDIVHISGEVQLVIRRNRNTYEMEYFWLPELLRLNVNALKSTSFRAMSNNRFKVINDL